MSDPNKDNPHPLAPLMERARREPFFLGFVLSEHARRIGWTDAQIAEQLQCPEEKLPQLLLCRCPDPADAGFAQDVHTIAEYVPCDELRLLQILREHSALVKFSKPDVPAKTNPFLLAARDRQETERKLGHGDDTKPAEEESPS